MSVVNWSSSPTRLGAAERIYGGPDTYSSVDLGGMVANLIPVTAGNIVGGALLVAAMYWLAYLRPRPVAQGGPERG